MNPAGLFLQIIKYAAQFGPYVEKVVTGILKSFAESHPEIMSPGPEKADPDSVDRRADEALAERFKA